MSAPKLHHYVPRFYLKQFADSRGRLWVYDKGIDRAFASRPTGIAAETQFYRLPKTITGSLDPLSIEKALSDLESRASAIMYRVLSDISRAGPGDKVTVTDAERLTVAEFLAAQHFRTLELRDLMLYLLKDAGLITRELDADEQKAVQFTILSDSGLLEEFAESIYTSIWLFAKNASTVSLITSDHPVCIKAGNNRMWIKGIGPLRDGSYIVFPMSPHVVLYCKEAKYWAKVKNHDLSVSPVELNADMVHHENCGQAFSASRFLVSSANDFEEVRRFIPTIGTDTYATSENPADVLAIKRTAEFLRERNR